MHARLASVLLAGFLAGCGTGTYDPGPQPDAKALITPYLQYLFPGSPSVQGLTVIPATPMNPGDIELAPVRPAQPLAPAAWIACLRVDDKGRRRYFAVFFSATAFAHIREAVPLDRCEGETYTMLRKKPPGT